MEIRMIGIAAISLALICSACNVMEEVSVMDTGVNKLESAYYKKIGSNIERLQALREGLFVMYQMRENEKESKPWLINGDSILVYSRRIGNPSRDGLWLLHQQFIAGLPGEPLLVFVEHFERISRDTFVGNSYIWEESPGFDKTSQDDFSLSADFDISELKKGEFYEKLTYVRQNSAHFKGFSPETSILNLKLKERYASQKDYYDIQPERMHLRRIYQDEEGKTPKNAVNELIHVMRRLPTEEKNKFR